MDNKKQIIELKKTLTAKGPAVREGADCPRRDPFIFMRLVGSSNAPTPINIQNTRSFDDGVYPQILNVEIIKP